MAVARFYRMVAAAGHEDALERALGLLADSISAIPGCLGVDVLLDHAEPGRFLMIERWDSVEAHVNSRVDKRLLASVLTLLDGPPEAAYMDYVRAIGRSALAGGDASTGDGSPQRELTDRGSKFLR